MKLLIIILIVITFGILGFIFIIGCSSNDNNGNSVNTIDISNNTNSIENSFNIDYEEENNVILEEDIEQEIPEEVYTYTDFELMQMYLNDFMDKAFNDTEQAYNLLNEEYRNKRFGNIENFKKFIKEKEHQFSNIEIIQNSTDFKGFDTVYTGTDRNGNYYYIREKEYMEYTIILDRYTMQVDYSNDEDDEKIKKHVKTFIFMINSCDYTHAYNLLEPAFKATHFPTEEDFINYIKSNWFENNLIETREITENGTCMVSMRKEIATTSDKIQKEFKVYLGEGIDFTIEFNI